jgi:hypothetical protein
MREKNEEKNVPREERKKYLEERLLLHKKEGLLWFCFNAHRYFKNSNKRGGYPL